MDFRYPMMLDVRDRLAVIVGGGVVGARKATGLLAAGATRVRMVAPNFAAAIPAGIERREKQYDSGDLDGAGLVFAATDDAVVNDAVVKDAQARQILVCRADACENGGDFVTPARFTQGEVIVAISAGSAALAATIRDGLGERFDLRWSQMAQAMQTLRPMIRDDGRLTAACRAELFRELANEDALRLLEAEGIEGLRHWLEQRITRHSST